MVFELFKFQFQFFYEMEIHRDSTETVKDDNECPLQDNVYNSYLSSQGLLSVLEASLQ